MDRLIDHSFAFVLCASLSILIVAPTGSGQAQPAGTPLDKPCAIAIPWPTPTPTPNNVTQAENQLEFIPKELDRNVFVEIAKRTDSDCDGLSDLVDKCIYIPNKNNQDSDGDGWGDACDIESADVSISITPSRKRLRLGQNVFFVAKIRNYGPVHPSGQLHFDAYFASGLKIDSITSSHDGCADSDTEGWVDCFVETDALAVGEVMTVRVLATAIKAGSAINNFKLRNGRGDLYRRNNDAQVRLTIYR